MTRRGWTILWSFALVVVFVLVGALVRVPYVAVGPGPTFNTLGSYNGAEVVTIGKGPKVAKTTGQLRMVTVSLTDDLSLFGALGMWVSGRQQLAPREEYFPPGQSQQQVDQQNLQQFHDSQSNAEVAALRLLKYPMKVLANSIVKGSPADGKIKAGEQLVAINNTPVRTAEQVLAVMRKTKPGQQVPVQVRAGNGAQRTVTLMLAKNPHAAYGFIGLAPVDRADVPFDVDFKLDDVGGPSAGLIFALTVVDKLTDGQLTGGTTIAGTGEIDSQGNVGPIGGINFKLVAAKEQGASTFLVPAANCSEAKAGAPEGMQLVKVTKLDDAVTDLKKLRAHDTSVPHC